MMILDDVDDLTFQIQPIAMDICDKRGLHLISPVDVYDYMDKLIIGFGIRSRPVDVDCARGCLLPHRLDLLWWGLLQADLSYDTNAISVTLTLDHTNAVYDMIIWEFCLGK